MSATQTFETVKYFVSLLMLFLPFLTATANSCRLDSNNPKLSTAMRSCPTMICSTTAKGTLFHQESLFPKKQLNPRILLTRGERIHYLLLHAPIHKTFGTYLWNRVAKPLVGVSDRNCNDVYKNGCEKFADRISETKGK